jgi:hypothetical protein
MHRLFVPESFEKATQFPLAKSFRRGGAKALMVRLLLQQFRSILCSGHPGDLGRSTLIHVLITR